MRGLRLRTAPGLAVLLIALLAGCASSGQDKGSGARGVSHLAQRLPPEHQEQQPLGALFAQTDQIAGQLIDTKANWHHPARLTVDEPAHIELSLGSSPEIERSIRQILPHGVTTGAGTVAVGPNLQAVLYADSGDAVIQPANVQNESTTSRIAVLFHWIVRPLRPTRHLTLTAEVRVPLAGTTWTHDLFLNVAVRNTWAHRLHALFTNWATISAMFVAFVVAPGTWLRRRLTRRRRVARRSAPPPDESGRAGPPQVHRRDRTGSAARRR